MRKHRLDYFGLSWTTTGGLIPLLGETSGEVTVFLQIDERFLLEHLGQDPDARIKAVNVENGTVTFYMWDNHCISEPLAEITTTFTRQEPLKIDRTYHRG